MITKCTVLFCYLLLVAAQEKLFRFDYEFHTGANGWLKFHLIPVTWQEARMRCHAEGAILASPLNNNLKQALIWFVGKQRGMVPTTIFTGVHATFSKGDYSSIEGVPLLRLPITWAPGEPDNYDNSESCLTLQTDGGTMSDARCDNVLPYMCFKKYEDLTMTECGTTDPAYTFDARTGSCYKFHSAGPGRGLVWARAYMTCAGEGGHLLIINSDLEATVIKDLYDKHPDNRGILVGFHDWGEKSTFLTIHGDTLNEAGYEKWGENQPDNSCMKRTGDLGESCGSTFKNLLLNDVWCNVPIPFVCEKSRNSLF